MFRDLRNGEQEDRMLNGEGVGEGRLEAVEEGTAESVGDLQGGTKAHKKKKIAIFRSLKRTNASRPSLLASEEPLFACKGLQERNAECVKSEKER